MRIKQQKKQNLKQLFERLLYSGFKGKMKEHKIFAVGAMVCMCFSMLSGHKMIAGKQGLEKIKKSKSK